MPQISSTQDLETRFSVFLNPIRDLTKNWEVDIAKYLEEYLEELAEVQITFDGGETLMNFAEAAMLIQGSATVYSKKVEFLWQMVLQMLDLLSSRRNVESGEAEGGKEGSGGGKAPLDFSLDFNTVDDIGEGRTIDLREEYQDEAEDSRRRGFKFLPATPLHLVEKEGEKSQHRVSLLMKNNEIFGAKDDFRINRSYLTPMGMLCMEVPTEILRDGSLSLMDFPIAGSERMDNAEKGKSESAPEAVVDPSAPQEENVHDGVTSSDHGSDVEIGDGGADFPDNMDPPTDDQMAMNIQEGCNEETDKDRNEVRNNNNTNVIDFPNGRCGLKKRGGAEKEAVTKLKLTDPWKPLDPHAESPAKRPVRAGRLRKPQPCACHLLTQTVPRRKYTKNKENANEDKKVRKSLPSIESYITGELVSMIGSSTKNHKVPPEILEEFNKEVAKRLEHGKRKRVKDLMNEGGTLNVEEAMQMVIEDTEIQQGVEEQLDDRIDCDGAADLDGDANDVPAPLFLPEPHDNTREAECVNKRYSDNQFYEPASDYEALVQKWVAEYITNAQEHVNSSSLVKRVHRWRETIMPKLKEEESRKEFDIHSYGSEVLSYFPDNGRKQTVPFSDLVKNRDPREVSRLFLSCLMLANTYNIELSESEPGDLAMDCLELTLLTRMRHHEELEGYAAPSQAFPPKRKSCAKAKHQSKSLLDETRISSGEPPPICADITQITLAENVQFNSKRSTRCRVRTKR